MKKLTPVFVVDRIEPCVTFWCDRLGFEKVAELPDGDTLGFVILVKDNVEIMYQTLESVRKDIPALAISTKGSPTPNASYIEVPDIDQTLAAFADWPLVVPRRTTFYGSTEFGVRDPGGNLIVFAQPAAPESPRSSA